MGATPGNQWWRLRSKHGRDKIFETPQLMEEAANEYFEWCLENPLIEIDYRGKDIEKVEIPKMRAFTMIGVCQFCGVNEQYFNQFEKALADKTDETSKDFSRVITHIRETVRRQKFEGAAAGFLNPTIIARDLGLADNKKIDTTLGGSITWVEEKTYVRPDDEANNQANAGS